MNSPFIQSIDGVRFRLREPYDFGFIGRYGLVFRVFDDQDSGNICFGTERDDERFFIKFAGAPTIRSTVSAETAISNLKGTVPLYRDLKHNSLIKLIDAVQIGGGFAMIFRWEDAICMGRQYPDQHALFMSLPKSAKLRIFDDITDFIKHTAAMGYVAVDFYDGSIMYDPIAERTVICDIDFFRKQPCVNDMGRMWGSSLFQSPEEYELGSVIDEITNVYTLGAAAFALFANYERTRESWRLGDATFSVAAKAVENDRSKRYSSITEFADAWTIALESERKGSTKND